ncbi:hypothetical protein ENSA7_47490 [Enhygromyxa salina]|uniref:Uncharacterized protein n=1 Tax=Enhygromyxa salina TaxID=215803 RepID=A0A2S9YJ86_9BACT|nr:hypothetical protein ENSA7_47490 [Enhygromyxa salina]
MTPVPIGQQPDSGTCCPVDAPGFVGDGLEVH